MKQNKDNKKLCESFKTTCIILLIIVIIILVLVIVSFFIMEIKQSTQLKSALLHIVLLTSGIAAGFFISTLTNSIIFLKPVKSKQPDSDTNSLLTSDINNLKFLKDVQIVISEIKLIYPTSLEQYDPDNSTTTSEEEPSEQDKNQS